MIKCVLFDADGVIINSIVFSTQYAKQSGIAPEEMIPFFRGEFQDCLIGKEDLLRVVQPWLAKWKWKGTAGEFLDNWFKLEHHTDERMVDIIVQLKKRGILCFLVTNQEKYRTAYMRTEMGFDRIFDKVYSSALLGCKKPEPEFYKNVLDNLKEDGIKPHQVLFFDDSPDNVAEGRKSGINAHVYTDFESFLSIVSPLLN